MSGETRSVTLHAASPGDCGVDAGRLAAVERLLREALGQVFPTAALLVALDGCVVLHRAYGHLDPDVRARPADTESLFDLASVSKLFTASALLRLANDFKLDLDDPVVEVVPELGAGGLHGVDGG